MTWPAARTVVVRIEYDDGTTDTHTITATDDPMPVTVDVERAARIIPGDGRWVERELTGECDYLLHVSGYSSVVAARS